MFNVINDAWIKTDKGKYGIRELLAKAPQLHEIIGENPINEYATLRFLSVFLMDAYQLKTIDDVVDLLERGEFDMKVIDAYVETCRREGVSFDIYDEKTPFLQEPRDAFDPKTPLSPIARLNRIYPVGTSKRFFDKEYASTITMEDDQIARYLTSITLHRFEGNSYGNCISEGKMYAIIKGENLFETLVMMIVPIDNAKRKYGLPYWRAGSIAGKAGKKNPILEPGLLYGMTLPIRRVNVLDNATVLYVGNVNYSDPLWRDPHVPYANDKVMNPKEEFYRPWGNLLSLVDPDPDNGEVLKTVCLYSPVLKDMRRALHIVTYEGITSKSKYADMRKNEFVLPAQYVGNDRQIGKIKALAEKVKDGDKYLGTSIKKTFTGTSRRPYPHAGAMKTYELAKYHEEADRLFEERLENGDFDQLSWIEDLKRICIKIFDKMIDSKLDAATMVKAIKQRDIMIASFNKNIMKLQKSANTKKED